MQNKLKLSAILLTLFIAIMPFTAITANAMTFELRIPSFGLYCETENAITHGKVKYVTDENGKAVQYSEYNVYSDSDLILYVPFISRAYELPEIDISINGKTVKSEICYGERFSLTTDKPNLDFYSADIDESITGTLYTLTTANKSLSVNFKTHEKQNFIYLLPYKRFSYSSNGEYSYTLENAQPTATYAIYAINGEFETFDSDADIIKETLTLKEYIDRNYNELNEYYSNCGNIETEFFYALANKMLDKNSNYEFFDFFLDSISEQRINAYKIEMPTNTDTCTIAYSIPVYVQKNGTFNPEIYLTEQTATGNYNVDYTIELNGSFPYVIESNANVKKQGDYTYTVENVSDDFYFVFSSAKKPKSIYNDNDYDTLKIVLIILLSIVIFALIIFSILMILHYKKAKNSKKVEP